MFEAEFILWLLLIDLSISVEAVTGVGYGHRQLSAAMVTAEAGKI